MQLNFVGSKNAKNVYRMFVCGCFTSCLKEKFHTKKNILNCYQCDLRLIKTPKKPQTGTHCSDNYLNIPQINVQLTLIWVGLAWEIYMRTTSHNFMRDIA